VFYTKEEMLFALHVSRCQLGTKGVFEMGQPGCCLSVQNGLGKSPGRITTQKQQHV